MLLFVGVAPAGVSTAAVGPAARIDQTPLVWPAGGRFLSAPLVVGGDVWGVGSLAMVDGTITTGRASFDDAPPELSLRMFTFVPDPAGGYTAVLRYRVPIVQLHSWRGIPVRMTQTVVLRPPNGTPAQAVQIQADGETAVGTEAAGAFTPTGTGQGIIAGNVVVIGVPASLGVTPDWTVQALVEVVADTPFQRNHPTNGFAAGTSIVPVGYLTGEASSSGGVAADAVTALTSTGTPSTALAEGVRVTATRIEGDGASRVVVVTTAAPISALPATQSAFIELDLAQAGFATRDHPVVARWIPGAAQATVAVDNVPVATVPVAQSGNDVRFEIGAATATSASQQPPTPRMDAMQYTADVTAGPDGDLVTSDDGIDAAPTPEQPDTVTIVFNSGAVTITDKTTGSVATGFVAADGAFVAFNDTEHYTGGVDQFGNVVMFTTRLTAGAASRLIAPRPAVLHVSVIDEYKAPDGFDAEQLHRSVWESFLKSSTSVTMDSDVKPYEVTWTTEEPSSTGSGEFAADSTGLAEPNGAQGGLPDWPLVPVSTQPPSAPTFMLQVASGTLAAGVPTEQFTPWLDSASIAAPGGVTPAASTTTIGATGSVTPSASSSPAPVVTTANPTVSTIGAVAPIAGKHDTGSGALWIIVVAVLAAASGFVVYVARRRRMRARPVDANPPTMRIVDGPTSHEVSDPRGGLVVGIHLSPGRTTHTAHKTEPEHPA